MNASNAPQLGKVAFVTNFIPPYGRASLLALTRRCAALRVLVSTAMEANRNWGVNWSGLDVVRQRTVTFTKRWARPPWSDDRLFLHFPLDTVGRLRDFSPDVTVSSEMGFRSLLASFYRKLRPQSTLMIWADISESSETGRGMLRRILRRVLRLGPDGFIVNGASGARYLNALGVPDRLIHRIPYATDADQFGSVPFQRPPELRRRLLYVGQLLERKGLDRFLNALAIWARQNPSDSIHFAIAGDGPLRPTLEAFRLPANLHLEFLGALPYEDLRRVYAAGGIFVLPSVADTWGIVVNEAMACGLPVLGSVLAPAVEELVEEGVNGWRFDPFEPGSISSAIESALNAPESRLQEMARSAQAKALLLSADFVAGMLVDAIQTCSGPVAYKRPEVPVGERTAWL